MKKKNFILLLLLVVMVMIGATILLYRYNIIPHKVYTDADFHITSYKSQIDNDGDGVDDQTDILEGVRAYIATNPKYKSNYYATGYPDDEYGVCTDVVAQGLLNAGYDLMNLVNEDIVKYKELYEIDTIDENIDFRRVKNLAVYLQNHAISLTTDVKKINEWQGGDIVVFKKHIAIISDKRNKKGIPFIIHHANPYQLRYEEDVLGQRDDIIGHYRIS